MTLATFFTNEKFWVFINSFAPWFSAFGTIAVVIISLYFSRKSRNIDVTISASVIKAFPNLHKDKKVLNFFALHITNMGFRSLTINSIGWESGFSKSKEIIGITPFNLDDMGMSSKFPPIKLSDGDQAEYFIPIKVFIDSIKMPTSKIKNHFLLNSIKVYTYTTTGKIFKSKIDKQLKKIIVDHFKNK
ncbi:MAG: hypothetical protein RAP70_03715 [Candidatus Celaenobacter antarcticus]|nr:hypothetical protein [Candidatus Celaenobacter antarcticus]